MINRKLILGIFLSINGVITAHAQSDPFVGDTINGIASLALYWDADSAAKRSKIRSAGSKKAWGNLSQLQRTTISAGMAEISWTRIAIGNHGYYVYGYKSNTTSAEKFSANIREAMYPRGKKTKFGRTYCKLLAYGSQATCRQDSYSRRD